MKKSFIVVFLLISSLYVFSQQITCEKTYGNGVNNTQINAIANFGDGSILLSGPKNVSGSYDIYFLRVKLDCDTVWTNIGVNVPNGGQDIKILNDQTFMFYGMIQGISGNPGDDYDLVLEKRNSNGDTIWRKRIGYGSDYEWAERFLMMSDGGFLLAGGANGLGGATMLIVKADNLGNEQWRRTFDWDLNDASMGIIESQDGKSVLAGKVQDNFTGVSHVRLIKLDHNGDSLFSKAVKVASPIYYETMRATYNKISATKDRGFLYTGRLDSNSTTYDFIAKVDSSFNLKWKYIDNVPNNILSKAYELADSSVILLVSKGIPPYNNQYYIYKFNKYGQKTGTLTFNSTECSQVRVTEMEYVGDSTFFVAGACLSNNNAYVAKLGKIGEPSIVTSTISPIEKDGDEWKVLVYPNPSSGIFNFKITGNNSRSYHLTLVNSIGQEAGDYSFNSKEFSIDVRLLGGIYFYLLSDEKWNVKRGKLILE